MESTTMSLIIRNARVRNQPQPSTSRSKATHFGGRAATPDQGGERDRRRRQPGAARTVQSALPRRQVPARRDHAPEPVGHVAGSHRDHQRLQAQLRSRRGRGARGAGDRNRRHERHHLLPPVRRCRHDRRPARRARPAARPREDENLLPYPGRGVPQEGIERDPGAAELMEEAVREGCDIVGGLPWYEYTDEDARQHIDICFEIAQAPRSRHPHAGGRHRRCELAQPRISRAQDHARGLSGPRRRQPLRRDGRLQ